MIGMILKIACSTIVNSPLEAIASDKKSIRSKIFPGIIIGILSVFSLGIYVVYARDFFSKRKIVNLQKALEEDVRKGDCQAVQDLLRQHPLLKTSYDLSRGIKTSSHISLMLPLAAESGNLEMVQLLCDNKATLEAFSIGKNKTPVEIALLENHKDIIKYLVDKGANVSWYALFGYINRKNLEFDMSCYLVEKKDTISSTDNLRSILGAAATVYDHTPGMDKKLIQLLIQKGDRLVEEDQILNLSNDVQQLINAEILAIAK